MDARPAITDADTARAVRVGRLRGAAAALGGVVALTVAVVLITVADDRQERLERGGVAVPGVVVRANDPLRGPDSVTYRYRFGGRTHTGHIGGSHYYEESAAVTVYVDPADPSRSTLLGEQPQSGPAYWTTIAGVTGGLIATVAGPASSMQWRRRRRVLQRAPWERRQFDVEWLRRGRLRLAASNAVNGRTITIGKREATRLVLPAGPDAVLNVSEGKRLAVLSHPSPPTQLALGRLAGAAARPHQA